MWLPGQRPAETARSNRLEDLRMMQRQGIRQMREVEEDRMRTSRNLIRAEREAKEVERELEDLIRLSQLLSRQREEGIQDPVEAEANRKRLEELDGEARQLRIDSNRAAWHMSLARQTFDLARHREQTRRTWLVRLGGRILELERLVAGERVWRPMLPPQALRWRTEAPTTQRLLWERAMDRWRADLRRWEQEEEERAQEEQVEEREEPWQ